MAHARRKFDEAVKAQGKKNSAGKEHRGLALIRKLYRVEKQARKLEPEATMSTASGMHTRSWLSCAAGWMRHCHRCRRRVRPARR